MAERRGADLRGSQLGPDQLEFRRSTWSHVDLRRADLRWSVCEADLGQIDLSNAKFTKTEWRWSNLCDLTFPGIVHGLEIGRLLPQPAGWRLEGVDLRRAKLRNSTG